MTDACLSIVVPVYNEEESLEQTVQEMEGFLDNEGAELILVNDGSNQETVGVLQKIKHPAVTILHHETNRGYGAALKTGLSLAQHEFVAITDADGTYPNKRIPEFFQTAKDQNLDMVVGARRGDNVNIPWLRVFPKWCIGQLANYVARRSIPDLNSGLRVMRKEIVEKYLSVLPDGFSFTSTITLAMLVNGFAVKYIDIDYHKRKGLSKIRPIRDTLNFIQLILRATVFFDPLRVFVPLGLLLWLAALVVVVLGVTVFGRIPDVTVGILAIGGLQVICLGLVADLINRKFASHL
ncbi:MAG: glycosyltransferase family 2 protein [Nitrospinota bacterium]|nr:glycosyltransferase family 2 protein [Nitrospinota bacterium]